MEDFTDEQADALQSFVNRVNDHIRTINLQRHGDLITVEEIAANCVFWLKLLDANYPELTPIIALIMQNMILRVEKVESAEDYERIKKGLLN